MQTFNDSLMDTLYYDKTEAYEGVSCKVTLDNDRIEVRYDEDDEPIVYVGVADAPGHFHLKCAENGGEATLHRNPNSVFLEGFWTEDGDRGMWRIELR